MISSADCSIMIISSKNDSSMCSVNGKASKIRNNSTSPIKHIIFNIYSQYATYKGEEYWSDLFANASRGSFQKGYKFTDGQHLTIKIRGVIQKIHIAFNDIQYIDGYYEALKAFITTNSGIIGDNKDENIFSSLPQIQNEEFSWTGQIPAANQVFMINMFSYEMGEEHFLSEEKTEELRQNLIGKIFSGDLVGTEISRTNGYKISSIQGLSFDDKGEFYFEPKPIKIMNIKPKKSTVTSQDVEEKPKKRIFSCSKGLSVALKHLYMKQGLA